jgi:hypothetical protein
MLACIGPFDLLRFLGIPVVALICSVYACLEVFFSTRRERRVMVAGGISVLISALVISVGVLEGELRDANWLALEVATPWLLGTIALVRWITLPRRQID